MSSTTLLYLTILIFCFILCSFSQHKVQGTVVFNIVPFISTFAILWYFSFWCNVGIDLPQYREIYENADFSTLTDDLHMEPGFKFLCASISSFTTSSFLGIGIIKTITLVLIFFSLFLLRYKIHLGFAILPYVSYPYFQSFDLIRISLAASIILLGYILLLDKKNKIGYVCFALSCVIHYSSVINVPLLLLLLIINKWNSKYIFPISIVVVLVIVIIAPSILTSIVAENIYLNKYESYVSSDSSSFGVMQFFYYIPAFAALYIVRKEKNRFKEWYIFVAYGFSIALLGYVVGMVTRMYVYFEYTFMVIVSSVIFALQTRSNPLNIKSKKDTYFLIAAVCLFIFLFKFFMSLNSFDKMEHIYPYESWSIDDIN